eukprot:gnl/Dysnectes_brevis/3002_a3702_787.p1 GENE.gnl/Dysnectes_brevis/3002_a3702_787~~gnl/Dysnectes_brevis/3002_a3702_787.p1  ORF type:complete len:285 (+),score=70.72 gnl/Dysnectes_brevis/3002_a3702_787:28-882(+)
MSNRAQKPRYISAVGECVRFPEDTRPPKPQSAPTFAPDTVFGHEVHKDEYNLAQVVQPPEMSSAQEYYQSLKSKHHVAVRYPVGQAPPHIIREDLRKQTFGARSEVEGAKHITDILMNPDQKPQSNPDRKVPLIHLQDPRRAPLGRGVSRGYHVDLTRRMGDVSPFSVEDNVASCVGFQGRSTMSRIPPSTVSGRQQPVGSSGKPQSDMVFGGIREKGAGIIECVRDVAPNFLEQPEKDTRPKHTDDRVYGMPSARKGKPDERPGLLGGPSLDDELLMMYGDQL